MMTGTKRRKPLVSLLLVFGCLSFLVACQTAQYMEARGESTVEVKSLKLFGFILDENTKELYTKDQLAKQTTQITAKAEAEAEAKTIMFKIKKKQDREDLKQNTAKLVSWVAFAAGALAIVLGVLSKGYLTWGIMAATFFIIGTTAIIIPELSDYIKWIILGGIGIVIIKAMSHSKEFSIGNVINRSGSQNETTKG